MDTIENSENSDSQNQHVESAQKKTKVKDADLAAKKISFTLDQESFDKIENLKSILNERSKRKWTTQEAALEVLQWALKSDAVLEIIEAHTSIEWRVEDALNDPFRRDAVLKALGMGDKTAAKKSKKTKDPIDRDPLDDDAVTTL